MEFYDLAVAFSLTLLAGLSTGIGSALAFLTKQTNTKFLSLALGFSAGVMIYVSFVEILPAGQKALAAEWGAVSGTWGTVISFFVGMLLIGVIDKFVPSEENPHEPRYIEELRPEMGLAPVSADGGHHPHFIKHALPTPPCPQIDAPPPSGQIRTSPPMPGKAPAKTGANMAGLHRTGIFTALAIAIHNFPEGLATFTAALNDPALGVAIAVAIAIHNIPEGIAVSVPIFYATGSRKKAFLYSFLSGLAEPLGALVGYLLLFLFVPADKVGIVLGLLFPAVAGIMVFISLDELLPAAQEYGEHHLCTYGAVAGMGVMAVSLLLFI